MTVNEIRELLPFYAANTLQGEELKAVEEALKDSEELREELEFWRYAKHATLIKAQAQEEGHASSVQIVDYARGIISDSSARLRIENHIQSCDQCVKVYDLIKSLQPEVFPAFRLKPAKYPSFFSKFKLAYFIPALAIILIAITFWLTREKEDQQQITQAPFKVAPAPKESSVQRRTIAFAFTYAGASRNLKPMKNNIPTIIIAGDVDSILFEIPVQHSMIAEYYEAKLFSPGARTPSLFDSLRMTSRGGELDLLTWQLGVGSLQRDGVYALKVKEFLIKEKRKYEPEEYEYKFQVKRE